MSGSWADIAGDVMARIYLDGMDHGRSRAQIALDIDAAYPFGERKHWPYKAWLSVRREFFACHYLPRAGARRSTEPDLFGEVHD
jgi:hypothetical protein